MVTEITKGDVNTDYVELTLAGEKYPKRLYNKDGWKGVGLYEVEWINSKKVDKNGNPYKNIGSIKQAGGAYKASEVVTAQSANGHSNDTNKSIMAQVALKCAVEVAISSKENGELDVVHTAKSYFDFLEACLEHKVVEGPSAKSATEVLNSLKAKKEEVDQEVPF